MIYSSERQYNSTEPNLNGERSSIDYAVLAVIERFLILPLHALTSVSGLLTNTLNLMVFVSLGVCDSMSVGIVALTATEFFMSGTELIISICVSIRYIWTGCPVDLWSVAYVVLGWIRYPGFFISSWITTVISLERCVSVVFPFKVKQIFTKKRSIVVTLCICGFYFGIVFPIFASLTVYWREDPIRSFNDTVIEKSIFTVAYTELTSRIETIIDTTCAVALSIISQIILIACTLLMIYTLRSSSGIRQQKGNDINSNVTKSSGWLKGSAMTRKERKMVKITLGLAIVIISVNIPRYVHYIIFYGVFNSDVDQYGGVFLLSLTFCDFLIALYSSCNFFVYFVLNTKFRNRLWKFFCLSYIYTT